jgi:hypothetical protein
MFGARGRLVLALTDILARLWIYDTLIAVS